MDKKNPCPKITHFSYLGAVLDPVGSLDEGGDLLREHGAEPRLFGLGETRRRAAQLIVEGGHTGEG